MTPPQIITWAIAIVAVLCSGGALLVAYRADRRATRAEKSSDLAAERELWTALIAAMQHAVTASVIYSDMSTVLLNIRSASMELIDGVDETKHRELGRWLHAEHKILPLLLGEASDQLSGTNPTVDEIVEAHVPSGRWAAGTISNLRLARQKIGEPGIEKQFSILADQAEANLKEHFGIEVTMASEDGREWRHGRTSKPSHQ